MSFKKKGCQWQPFFKHNTAYSRHRFNLIGPGAGEGPALAITLPFGDLIWNTTSESQSPLTNVKVRLTAPGAA